MASTLLAPADAYRAALRGAECRVVDVDASGWIARDLATWRWTADPDASDGELLARCVGATVDIGCGPGRMTAELLARGIPAMGIDVVAEAVRQANERGGMALKRDVFRRIPGEGRWETALLADGNIGIGGDPLRLLRRVGAILTEDGRVIVDLGPPGGDLGVHRIALEVGGRRTRPFRWAVVPADGIEALANEASMRVLDLVEVGGRWFAELLKASGDA